MKNQRARIGAAGLLAAALGAGVVGIVLAPASATSSVTTDRFVGANRYDTARLVATYKPVNSQTFAFGTPTQAVVVSGDNFPDALSSSFLAGSFKSPIFLTSQATLAPEAVQGLQALGIKQVTIVGGPAAVDPSEDTALQSDGINATRIAGGNRDATAALVAQATGTFVGSYGTQGSTALLAADDTDHYVDALSAGPLSWFGHLPILLTPTDTLAPETQAALSSLNIHHVVILGGSAAVSDAVESQITGMGLTTERLAGGTRQQTAIAIANAEHDLFGFTFKHMLLALGDNFPDALAGGALGGLLKSPILLTGDTNDLSSDTQGFFDQNDGTVSEISAFGGANAIADAVLAAAAQTSTCKTIKATTTTAGLPLGLAVPNAPSAADIAAAATTTTAASSGTTTTLAATTTIPVCNTTTTVKRTTTTAGGSTTVKPTTTTTTGLLP